MKTSAKFVGLAVWP